MSSDADFVTSYLKQHDRDRYYATLVLPEKLRGAVQALYAFNAEIAQIPLRVSEPQPGEIRLQWWVDLLEHRSQGEVSQNPLASQLCETVDRFDLPTGPLRRLLAARRFDLYGDPMPDMGTFEGYAGETNSILYQLTAMILNVGNQSGASLAAGHLGVAHTLIGHLRSLSMTASRGQIYLPFSIFAANGVSEGDLFSGKATSSIIAATAQLREIARSHLQKAISAVQLLPRQVRPAFAFPAILTPQLQRLGDFADIPFVCPPDPSNWQKIARLIWWNVRN